MESAITVSVPPELTLAEDQKARLSTLVHIKLEETKTLPWSRPTNSSRRLGNR
jgi:hypothetical protein